MDTFQQKYPFPGGMDPDLQEKCKARIRPGRNNFDEEVKSEHHEEPKKSRTNGSEKAEDVQIDDEFPYSQKTKIRLSIGSDAEIAQCVVNYIQSLKGRLIYAETAFYTFDKTAWKELSETNLRRIIARWDGATYTKPGAKSPTKVQINNNRVKSILAIVADIVDASGFFDDKADGINVANGFLSFDSNGMPNLLPHSPDHRCRHTLKARWNGKAVDVIPEGTLLHKLMYGCFKGQQYAQDMIDLIAEVYGVSAAGRVKQAKSPKAVILYGQSAENGKSQILKLGESLLPANSVSNVAPANMGDDRKAVKMAGKLLNTANELTAAAIESDAFKQAITGEPLQVRDVYKSAIELRCTAQHIFATNVLPGFRGGFDAGVRRRLLVIPFKRTIPVDERILDIGERVAKEEADLVLSWIVNGLSRFIKKGDYSQPSECLDALTAWIIDADQVAGWVNEFVESTGSPHDTVQTKDAWKHFNEWCKEIGLRNQVPALKAFTERARVSGIKYVRRAAGGVFTGIRVRGLDEVLAKLDRIENRRQGIV